MPTSQIFRRKMERMDVQLPDDSALVNDAKATPIPIAANKQAESHSNLILNLLDGEAFDIVAEAKILDTPVSDETFSELRRLLDAPLHPTVYRHQFHARGQLEGETVRSFARELRHLTERCYEKESAEELRKRILEQLAEGIRPTNIKGSSYFIHLATWTPQCGWPKTSSGSRQQSADQYNVTSRHGRPVRRTAPQCIKEAQTGIGDLATRVMVAANGDLGGTIRVDHATLRSGQIVKPTRVPTGPPEATSEQWNVQLHADVPQVSAALSLGNLPSGRLLRTWERYVAVDRRRGIKEDLAFCFQQSHTRMIHQSMFLGVLRMHHPTLPRDPRTLMRTPRDCPKKYIGSGVYAHIGLEKALLRHLSLPGKDDYTSAQLQLLIDGVSPFNASKTIVAYFMAHCFTVDFGTVRIAAGWYMVHQLRSPEIDTDPSRGDTAAILELDKGIAVTLSTVNSRLQALETQMARNFPPSNDPRPAAMPETFRSPARTQEDLVAREAELAKSDVYNVVKSLARMGGTDVADTVRRIMSSLTTNLTGTGNKRAACDLLLMEVVEDAISSQQRYADISAEELRVHMRRWCRNARDRAGGRMQRRAKQSNQQNVDLNTN
ncbi:uncharacterized protein DEA37_0010332 [Paragonimus westermani]|uniref:Uncharacterized protein n=1 Tax=Paragonimus westermani TaxID=34504 RepID=A0A5J4N749_9TREM|nr:uncharacterized protein DEA37_0010332 [Paragonimus westermani]